MSDRAYFQGLYDTALDFTMKAYYAAAVRERNNGALGDCQHMERRLQSENFDGAVYYWYTCDDCGVTWGQVLGHIVCSAH